MTELTTSLLEKFILAENKRDILKDVTPFSSLQKFLDLMIEIHDPKLPAGEFDKLVKEFAKTNANEDHKQVVRFKALLKSLADPKTDAENAKKLINEVNSTFLHRDFNYENPFRTGFRTDLEEGGQSAVQHSLTKEQLESLSLEKVLREVYEQKDLALLKPEYYEKVDIGKLNLTDDWEMIKSVLRQAKDINLVPGILDIVKKALAIRPDDSFILFEQWGRLNLENQEKLINEKTPVYFNFSAFWAFVSRKFELDQLTNPEVNTEKKINVVKPFIAYLEGAPHKFAKLKRGALQQLLSFQAELDIINKVEFLNYLREPMSEGESYFKRNHTNKLQQKRQQDKEERCNEAYMCNTDDRSVIEKYLTRLLKDAPHFKEFEEFFEIEYLAKIFLTQKLLQGEECPTAKDVFSESELQELFNRRILSFDKKNKSKFKNEEKVEIKVEIKNVSNLTVRIFEVNTLNYLLENKNQNFETIDVSGLIPSGEYLHKYSQNSMVCHTETFNFQNIQSAKKGVFIIDFLGEQIKSRAVIYKGQLNLIYDKSEGRSCVILDENGEMCKGSSTGIYIGNTFFETDLKTGVIEIPFSVATVSQLVIVTHNSFADFCMLSMRDPNPELRSNVIFNSEEFIPGNKVSFVIEPKLTMYGRTADLGLLDDLSVTISTVNDKDVQSKNEFKKLKYCPKTDLVVEFIFPPKVMGIHIVVEAAIAINKEPKKLKVEQGIQVTRFENQEIQNLFFQKQKNGEILIYVLGKNGEPRKNQCVQVEIQTVYQTGSSPYSLITDEQGKVSLGELKDFEKIGASCGGVRALLNKTIKNDISYPSELVLNEGDDLTLPIDTEHDKIRFGETYSTDAFKSEFSADKLLRKEGRLHIQKLAAGSYRLKINDTCIAVTVHKGVYSNIGNQILTTDTSIIGFNDLKGIWFQKLQQTDSGVAYEIASQSKHVKARLLTYNFMPKEFQKMLSDARLLDHNCSSEPNYNYFPIKKVENTYSSQIRLNDEMIYVYDRKTKKNFMGNTLEKPGVILKRNRIGETTETEQTVNAGELERHMEKAYANAPMYMDRAYAQQRMMAHKQMRAMDYDDDDCSDPNSKKVFVKEFLRNPGRLIPNLKVENGKVEIPKNLIDGYSFAFLHVSDGNFFSILPVQESASEIKARDCTLQESKKPGYIYAYGRQVHNLGANKKMEIKNIDNTQIFTITSLKELYEAYSVLNKGLANKLKEWDFLPGWSTLEPMEKLKKYDKFACHELNVFVYNKDREFFDDVVKPFLVNKKEKHVVDHFLLADHQKVRHLLSISAINELNYFEKILVAVLAKKESSEFAKSVQNLFKSSSALSKMPKEEEKAKFETLLNINAQSDLAKQATGGAPPPPGAPPLLGAYGASNFVGQQMYAYPPGMQMSNMAYPAPQMEMMGRDAQMDYVQCNVDYDDFAQEECEEADYRFTDSRMDECERAPERKMRGGRVKEKEIFTASQGTVEYREKHYYDGVFNHQIVDFWTDLLNHLLANDSPANFMSTNFMNSVQFLSEFIIALAYTDLAFDKPKIESSVENNKLTIEAKSNILVLTKEVIEKEAETMHLEVLCSQNIFDPEDPVIYDDEDTTVSYDKLVDECIVGKTYASRIVITNSTTTSLQVNLIYEIPQGAIPIDSMDNLNIVSPNIPSFHSEIKEFKFYFPKAGKYTLFPATVVKSDKIVSTAKAGVVLDVKTEKTNKVLKTMSDVISNGNIDDIVEFIKSKNLLNPNVFSFSQIYWLLKNKGFYEKIIEICQEKGIFDDTVWSFSILHGDTKRFSEFLRQPSVKSLFSFAKHHDDSVFQNDTFTIREYYPLINPRAHVLGTATTNIVNNTFKKTYDEFLYYLFLKRHLSVDDYVLLINYLIVQDQIEKALEITQKLSEKQVKDITTNIQFEYQTAYLSFITGYPDFTKAKAICEKYLTYPVLTWRNLFVEMANQLAEFEESESFFENTAKKEGELLNKQKSAKVPSFTASLDNGKLKFVSFLVGKLVIKFYKVELEVIFSLNPFSFESKKSYKYVSPFFETSVKTNDENDLSVTNFEIPEAIAHENLFVEIRSINEKIAKSEFLTWIPFKLNCFVTKELGILKCFDQKSNKPVPKVYVKCFAKYTNGTIKFYKDGYTDLRGSFDYVSLNSDKIDNIDSFAIFVTSADFGSKILIENPPKKIGRVEGEAKQLISDNWAQKREQNIQCQKKSSKMNQYAMLY